MSQFVNTIKPIIAKEKRPSVSVVLIQQLYTHLSGKTFLRKGSSPNPFPKTFNRILPPYRAHLKK